MHLDVFVLIMHVSLYRTEVFPSSTNSQNFLEVCVCERELIILMGLNSPLAKRFGQCLMLLQRVSCCQNVTSQTPEGARRFGQTFHLWGRTVMHSFSTSKEPKKNLKSLLDIVRFRKTIIRNHRSRIV